MDVIIYSFFIVTGIAGASYYAIRLRYTRLLEAEQEKSFASRNNELQLASEKQRLESSLKEKEAQIADTRARILTEESKSVSLSSEVLTKDKQIQSLTAQLQHETSQRASLEKELHTIEQQLAVFRSKASTEETKASTLSSDVMTKEQQIGSLTAALQQQSEERQRIEQELAEQERRAAERAVQMKTEEEQRTMLSNELQQQMNERSRTEQALSEKEREAAALTERIRTEQEQRAALTAAMDTKEAEYRSAIDAQRTEIQRLVEALRQETEARRREQDEQRIAETRAQEAIRELQHQTEQLQNELGSTRGANETLNSARELLSAEFQKNEGQLRQQLAETEILLTITQQDLQKTSELLQEQSALRQTTEQALQESKQRLYAHIGELEQKQRDQANAIAALQTQLTQAADDVHSAEQSIHNILRSVPIPVFVVNANGICEYCNAALEELVGYGMSELNEKHFSRLLPEDERAFYEEQWRTSSDRAEQFQGETRIIAATGDPISASVNFIDIRPNGAAVKYVGFIMDRTVEKDSQKHFLAAQEREQELLDLKSRFIAMVTNQLRTSLVTVATNTELLERFMDKWSDERRYHSFLRINESIRQMIELVRDVSFTTKASTEPYTLTLSTIDLESLIQSSAKTLIADLESHHHFILAERGDITAVPLDAALVKTIMDQLLSNAFKYSRDNTEVNVSVERSGASCLIRIRDQGIGIPAAEQKHLFSSFFRASNVSNIYGTGLGLTIVQQCVQMHGGSITIESELHKGTAVTVTLPVHTSV
jgi:PAS domain S-box-containing protein